MDFVTANSRIKLWKSSLFHFRLCSFVVVSTTCVRTTFGYSASNMIFKNILKLAPAAKEIQNLSQIPDERCLVYILARDSQALVCGLGHKNRARVIFDDGVTQATPSHIKSLFLRTYHRHGDPAHWQRFIVPCADRKEASALEKLFHAAIGGNTSQLPQEIVDRLKTGLSQTANMVLDMARYSAFSGLRDLRKWREVGVIDNTTWDQITDRLGTW